MNESPQSPENAPEPIELSPRVEGFADTMFRNVVSTHVEFTFIADNKAYVMICANSIIIGALTTLLVPHLKEQSHLLWPTILMFCVCLVSLSFSILSIRPAVGTGTFTRDAVRQRKTNLLFFGNFHASKREDFDWAMRELLKDENYIFSSMIQDVYYLGRALGLKYKQVRISYDIFLIGMIASVLFFVVMLALAPGA
ncbi:phosphohydrolase [Haloferula helveola]|uniref:Phosphohydrolase n=1 Tax=Haloferula helveola TaxID=490095 RepID=A0ABM7RFI3_9BACT|nr:phosphohydrolase [Haloferula helveola]